jgi:serine/threonine protein phosphatase PrpC
VSRAIGDWEYKDPGLYIKMARERKKPVFNRLEALKYQISPFPQITKVPMVKENDYMIIACDGIWDVYTN